MAMGKISTLALKTFTLPSFAAPNTSSATPYAKSFTRVIHVPPMGKHGR